MVYQFCLRICDIERQRYEKKTGLKQSPFAGNFGVLSDYISMQLLLFNLKRASECVRFFDHCFQWKIGVVNELALVYGQIWIREVRSTANWLEWINLD